LNRYGEQQFTPLDARAGNPAGLEATMAKKARRKSTAKASKTKRAARQRAVAKAGSRKRSTAKRATAKRKAAPAKRKTARTKKKQTLMQKIVNKAAKAMDAVAEASSPPPSALPKTYYI
jgi:hypothetical protein